MTMKELLAYSANKKKEKAAEYRKVVGYGTIQGFTQAEFNESIKLQSSKIKSRTRRVYSKGNRWSAHTLPRIKQNIITK
jgi:hypothetical protein